MSFWGIVTLVFVALVLLSLLFVFFKAFIFLLPVGLIAIALIWLIGWFSGRKNKTNMPSGNYYDWFKSNTSTQRTTRKQARNVTTKDVDK